MSDQAETKREFTGKSVEEAQAAAAAYFDVTPEQLDTEVLAQPGSLSALFGRKVRILAWLHIPGPRDDLKFAHTAPAAAPAARSSSYAPAAASTQAPSNFDPIAALTLIAKTIVDNAIVEARESEEHLILDIKADGSGIFIGRKGATLEAIQFLMTLMSQKQGWQGKRILVDSERYRERRIDSLREKCREMAEKAKATGQAQRTELLDAAMRKIVHSEIKKYPDLRTKSIGEGDLKRVQILPAGGRPYRVK